MKEKMRVLKVMNEVKDRMSLDEFAVSVGLTSSQTLERIQELVDDGFMRKTEKGFGITEKGRNVLKLVTPVSEDMEFHFYTEIGENTGYSARSLEEFYELTKKIDVDSLEFHVSRGDFESWIREVFGESEFAEELSKIRKLQLKGENLREEILRTTETKFEFGNVFS